jgi:hypothetical protein
VSGLAPQAARPLSPAGAAWRLAVFVAACALITSRIGLVVHELIGHGSAANAVGAGVDDVRLFWFAGGWIHYSRTAAWTLGDALIVQLGGIAVELVVGLAAMLWARRRTGWLGLAVTGAGAGWVIHAAAYLSIGCWHGYGDGVLIHRVLGSAQAAVALPAAGIAVAAAYLAARALTGRLEAVIPSASRAARLAILAAALAVAGGVNAGLSRAELGLRDDSTYGAIMTPEREREIQRELAAWLAAQRERGIDVDRAAIADQRRALDRSHPSFPFGLVVILAIVGAGVVGAARSRRPESGSVLDRRVLSAVVIGAVLAWLVVVGAGAIFPL